MHVIYLHLKRTTGRPFAANGNANSRNKTDLVIYRETPIKPVVLSENTDSEDVLFSFDETTLDIKTRYVLK